jgi:trimeric autotransporter adhesin
MRNSLVSGFRLSGLRLITLRLISLRLISAVTMLAVFSGCGGGTANSNPGGNTPVLTSIQVTGPNATLTAGQKQQMTATGIYSNGPTKDLTSTATWSSSSAAVTVVAGGMVTAAAAGSSAVSAKLGSVTGSTNLTVNAALVSIAVTPANPSVAAVPLQQFTATGNYSDGSTQNLTASVTWGSSNTTAATISGSAPTQGLANALATGSTTVLATLGAISGSTTLTVTSAVVTSISVSPINADIPLGIAQQFTATGTFSDSSVQDITGAVTWKSSVTSIASITVSGLATGLNVGSTNISATLGPVMGSAPLLVNAANLSSIAITPSNGSIAQGTTIQLMATGTFNDGGTRNLTHQVSWSSSDTTVATIGAGTGIASGQPRSVTGTTIITATLGSATQSVNLTITNATITSISVTPSAATIPIGAQKGFTATGLFSDSTTQDITANSHWTSNNASVATVGSGGGATLTATAIANGTANINASFGGVSDFSILTVDTAALVSLAISPANSILSPGSSASYNAMGTFSDGSHMSMNGAVTWTSSNSLVATVLQSGTVTGQSAGTTTIKVQSGAISATANLVVEGSTLSSLQVFPANSSVPESIAAGFTVIGTFANGDTLNLTGVAVWTSSAPSVATISNAAGSQGQAIGSAPGNTVISALFAGQVGTASLTVTNATLTSISVTPTSASISLGSSQQFDAVGTFSDGSTLTLTSQATWASSDIPIAVVNSVGLASSVASGSATITATLNGVSGSAILTVQ